MKSKAQSVEEYVNSLPPDRRPIINKLRDVVKMNLPDGFFEEMNYGMIGYVVPLSIYPGGYLGNKRQPLPFMNIASQKNTISLYHMGIYADSKLMNWFKSTYETAYSKKLDMGKSCIRFRSYKHIPYDLIGELSAKISATEWIKIYEEGRKNRKDKLNK